MRSVLVENADIMCGSATFTMFMSSTAMNRPIMTMDSAAQR
jgi:hypothetical protein